MMCQEQLESLWSSGTIEGLLKFYSLIREPEQLFRFSRNRPAANTRLIRYNWDFDKRIIFVVPTADFKHMPVRIPNLFSGIPILFVESSGQFFNYSRSVNRGISEALKFNPDWIILSNDDVWPLRPLNRLTEQLSKVSSEVIPAILPSGSHATPYVMFPFAMKMVAAKLLYSLSTDSAKRFLGLKISKNINNLRFHLLQQYGVSRIPFSLPTLIDAGFYSKINPQIHRKIYIVGGDFIIFPRSVAKLARFDETFINGGEDHDLGMQFFPADRVQFLNYTIESIGGATLSPTRRSKDIMALKDVLNLTYLYYKWKIRKQGIPPS
jgi:hypothetical protein